MSQTDGNKHTTRHERNVLEQVKEIVDPLGHKTLKEYDQAGNLISVTDAAKRITTYKYNVTNASRKSRTLTGNTRCHLRIQWGRRPYEDDRRHRDDHV
jgi:YD repeat-containing protein